MNPFDMLNKKIQKEQHNNKLSQQILQTVDTLFKTQLLSGNEPNWNEISQIVKYKNSQKLKQIHFERNKNKNLDEREIKFLMQKISHDYKEGVKQIDYTVLGDRFQKEGRFLQKAYEQYIDKLIKNNQLLTEEQIKEIINQIQNEQKIRWVQYQKIYGYPSGKIFKAIIQYLQKNNQQEILNKIYKPKQNKISQQQN